MTLKEFTDNVKGVREKRTHKVSGSLGVYDAYKFIRKRKWQDIGQPLTEKEFYSIIRRVGNYLADSLCNGNDIKFPSQMGTLELRKNTPYIGYNNNKLKVSLPIDWTSTFKLWFEDSKAYEDKKLVKLNECEIFKVIYNRSTADYNNKSFYEFKVNRDIKRTLSKRIKQGKIDAFLNNIV